MGDVTKSRFANAGPDQQNARKGAACTRAFTLIELMIVVAIIGILAAMAIPNFMTFVVRAKQVEAKGNLKAWYTVAVANVAEHGTYACGFCNFRPEKGYLYNYHGGGAAITDGRRGCTTAQGNLLDIGQTTTGFTVGAAGNIDTDTVCDSWQIDDANRLINVQNDAGS